MLALSATLASGCGLRINALPTSSGQLAGCAPDTSAILPNGRAIYAADGVNLNNSHSAWPTISGDGRTIAFHSWGTNLVAGTVSGKAEVYVQDIVTGALEIVSRAADGTLSNSAGGDSVAGLSCTARYVVFPSRATNLTTDVVDGTHYQVFWKDRETGEVRLVSKTAAGAVGNTNSGVQSWDAYRPQVSMDGRYVTFSTWATNLVPGAASGSISVVRKDMQTGEIAIASQNPDTLALGDAWSNAMDPTGRYVAFTADSTALGPTGSTSQIFIKDMEKNTLSIVSKGDDGSVANSGNATAQFNSSGEYLAFFSSATNLAGGTYVSGYTSVYRLRVATGKIDFVGVQSNLGNAKRPPGISYDGSVVLWLTTYAGYGFAASQQVVAKNMNTGVLSLVSKSEAGVVASSGQEIPALAPNGRWSVFQGVANNLVPATPMNYETNWQAYTLPTGF